MAAAVARPLEGQYTATVYGLIREEKHSEAIRLLELERQCRPGNRAALSLLGYCYYQAQRFPAAVEALGAVTLPVGQARA